MHQILYVSECQIPHAVLDVEITNILNKAKTNNQRDGLTGLFLLIENRFIQLLEGEEEKVLECMDRIKSDPRHSDLRILLNRPIENRLFDCWSMHFFKLSTNEAIEKIGIQRLENLGISNWKEEFKNNLAIMLIESYARLGVEIQNVS